MQTVLVAPQQSYRQTYTLDRSAITTEPIYLLINYIEKKFAIEIKDVLSNSVVHSMHEILNLIFDCNPKRYFHPCLSLVTQPMLQLRPNRSLLRLMDYYYQIFCRFQKCKRKVPPPALPSNDFEKSWFFSKILVTFFFFFANKIFSTIYRLLVQNFMYWNLKIKIRVI